MDQTQVKTVPAGKNGNFQLQFRNTNWKSPYGKRQKSNVPKVGATLACLPDSQSEVGETVDVMSEVVSFLGKRKREN